MEGERHGARVERDEVGAGGLDGHGGRRDRAITNILSGSRRTGAGAPSAAKAPETDEWLTVRIQTALYSDMRFMGRGLGVDTEQGVVTLRGKVDSEQAKAAAAAIAKSFAGTKDVRNELHIVPSAERERVDTRDNEIGRVLKEQFRKDSELKDDPITIRVDASVVTLIGEVQTAGAGDRAAQLAQSVPGVSAVENELTFLSQPVMGPGKRPHRVRVRPPTEK
jgi:osmotically-inducible protein OsmY